MTTTAAARTLGATCAVLLLAACGPATREDRGAPEVIHDEEAGGYYTEEYVTTDLSLLDGELAGVPVTATGVLVEGQFTDPADRVPIPAPDDYWIHAAIDVDPAVAGDLVDAAVPVGGEGPVGEGDPADPVPVAEITPLLVDPVEQAMRDCPGGWFTVDPLTPPGEEDTDGKHHTTTGLRVSATFACRGGDQVLVAMHET